MSDGDVSCTAPATRNSSLQILFKSPTPTIVFCTCCKTLMLCSLLARCRIPCACHTKLWLNIQKWSEHAVLLPFSLRNVLRATTACSFWTSQLPKVLRSVLSILTSKRAIRHNRVHIQKLSERGVLSFWLRRVLCATMACTFRTSQGPKVLRTWCPLYVLTWTCASRACFSTSQLPKVFRSFWAFWLQNVLRATATCNCLSLICPGGSAPAALASLLFDPPEPQNIGQTQCFATFLPFRAPWSSFYWLFLFSDLLSSFSSLTLPTSGASSVHIVGSLTSKLPSISKIVGIASGVRC